MALNLRKLGKYMERKQRKEPSPILKVIIKIGLGFFGERTIVPLFLITPLLHFPSQRHQSDKWFHPTNLPNVRHKSQWRYHQPRLG